MLAKDIKLKAYTTGFLEQHMYKAYVISRKCEN